MIELLESINHWHWLALGLALIAFELLGTAGYFLWIGLSALAIGALLSSLPMSWQLQWSSFAVFSLATTWLWWRKQHKKDAEDDNLRDLNEKKKQLIGQIITITEDLPKGTCRLRVGDTTWKAELDQTAPKGSQIEVIDVKGITLKVRKNP